MQAYDVTLLLTSKIYLLPNKTPFALLERGYDFLHARKKIKAKNPLNVH